MGTDLIFDRWISVLVRFGIQLTLQIDQRTSINVVFLPKQVDGFVRGLSGSDLEIRTYILVVSTI